MIINLSRESLQDEIRKAKSETEHTRHRLSDLKETVEWLDSLLPVSQLAHDLHAVSCKRDHNEECDYLYDKNFDRCYAKKKWLAKARQAMLIERNPETLTQLAALFAK